MSFSDQRITDTHFDYTSSLQNVTVSDSRGLFVDGCKASSSYGVDDIVITDQDGYLAASLDGTSFLEAIPGAFVSNRDYMKFDDCIEYPDNCLAFCPGRCLRTLTYSVEQYGTENWKLKVTGELDASFQAPYRLNFYELMINGSFLSQMTMVIRDTYQEIFSPEIRFSFLRHFGQGNFLLVSPKELTLLSLWTKREIKFGQDMLRSCGKRPQIVYIQLSQLM